MKILFPGLLLFFGVVSVLGQSSVKLSSVTPNIEVLQNQWRVMVRNPLLDEDPFRANNERNQAELDQKEARRVSDIRIRQGKPAVRPPVRMRPIESKPLDPWATYFYEIKIKNNGQKEIRAIVWDYVFFEPGTQREVGRRQFISKESVDPGKTKTLIIRSTLPPTDTIEASKSDKKPRNQYSEQIIISAIEYQDGSIWQISLN